ncbi:MAG TPA: hypothetical protein VFV37_06655, partial [Luteibaculaceae bacterium]|nr:hypothetical protein [Luteibaculaceae bacterium]
MRAWYSYIALLLCLSVSSTLKSQCTVKASANFVDLLCGDTLRLTAIGNGVTAFRNNFNCGAVQCPQGDPTNPNDNFGVWSNSSTAQFDNPCLPDHPSGTPHIWFNAQSPSPRVLATAELPLSTGGIVKFDMRFADRDLNGNTSPCENPDLDAEGVHVQYSNDNGNTWNTFAYYSPNGGDDPVRTVWTTYTVGIPAIAQTNNTRIRIAQLSNSQDAVTGAFLDHWGLDNVEVIVNPPNATYTWSHTGLTKPTGDSDPFPPVNTNTYTVTYNDGSTTCTDQITVVIRRPTIAVTQTPNIPLCPGDPVQFFAVSSLVPPNLTCGLSTEGCKGNTAQFDVGTGAINNTNYHLFGRPATGGVSTCLNGSGNTDAAARTQFIVRASELPAFFKKGQINQLQLNLTAAGSWPNFTIKMGCTSKTAFAGATQAEFATNLVEVYSSANQGFVAGWNLIEFDQAYDWDGTQNLIFQICWNGATKTGNVLKTATPFNSVIHTFTCGTVGCEFFQNGAVMDVNRPSLKLGVCYRPDPILVYSWTPSTNLSDDSIPNPTTTASNTTYTVTVRDLNTPPGCAVSENVTISLQTVGTVDARQDSVCVNGTLRLYADLSTPDPAITFNWTGPNGFTSNMQNPTRTPAEPGWYYVTAAKGGCSGRDSVLVKVGTPPNPGIGYVDSLCSSNTVPYNLFTKLTGGPLMGGTWTSVGPPSAGPSLSGSNFNASAAPTIPGTYLFRYTVTTTNGCPPQSSDVSIKVTRERFAGLDSTLSACNSGGTLNLRNLLRSKPSGQTPDLGGSWASMGQANPGTNFNAAAGTVNINNLAAGSYAFTYSRAAEGACPQDDGIISLTLEDQPNAGPDINASLCLGNSVDLNTLLPPAAETGGTWEKAAVFPGSLDPNGNYSSSGAPTGNALFRYVKSAISPCRNDTAMLVLKLNDAPIPSNGSTNCATNVQTYTATFEISGGDPATYNINPSGSLSGSNPALFTSNPIPTGSTVTFTVSDANGCGSQQISFTRNCACQTRAGLMDRNTVELCFGQQTSSTIYQGGFVNDGNDAQSYILHQGPSTILQNIVAVSNSPVFAFDPARMQYGVTYYISAAAANDSSGFAQLSDICLDVSAGTPVVFYPLPTGSMAGGGAICPGDASQLTFMFTQGDAPFTVEVLNETNNTPNTYSNLFNSNANATVSPTQTTSYRLTEIQDSHGCITTLTGNNSVTVTVNQAPIATLMPGNGCSDGGSNPGSFDIQLSGAGSQFTVEYTSPSTGQKVVLSGLTPPMQTINPSDFDPNSALTFTLDSVYDNSGTICPGVVSGTVTISPRPTAILSGGGQICISDAVRLPVQLTGVGPWLVSISDGVGGSTQNFTVNSRQDTLVLTNPGPGLYNYQIT